LFCYKRFQNQKNKATHLAEIFRQKEFSMNAHSILFKKTEDNIKKETLEGHAFFQDLNLDQVIDSMTGGRQNTT
jgi:hypothetical protein